MLRPLSNLLVTGGCGFIGSAFIRNRLSDARFGGKIVNLDLLTYAANFENLNGFHEHPRYQFMQGDIRNESLVERLCMEHEIDAVVHFAAETHVDRSIASPLAFIETNVQGTMHLLEVVRKLSSIHFHHVSTDEVYGALGSDGFFNEESPHRPNSPYSASKAASDHLVRAYAKTYNLSTTISHCSNNYGPGQHPEKFIPLMITRCFARQPLPVYGNGLHVRDWLYVDDHAEAIWSILEQGERGETYDIGGGIEKTNLQMLSLLIDVFCEKTGVNSLEVHKTVCHVSDRPGHDFRYGIDCSKISRQLGWAPRIDLRSGLKKTIQFYRDRSFKGV